MHNVPQRSNFYDLEQVRQIPIIDVCKNLLGLECVVKSGKTWFKARDEKTPSALLHEQENTFHDFGSGKHGDVIVLVSYVTGMSWKDALDHLAKSYHIEPIDQRKGMAPTDLLVWEYSKIGLAGDMATKNFSFHPDYQSPERIAGLSGKYGMPMNELRRKHPQIYEQLLRQVSLPYVYNLRNDYYLDVWSEYRFLCHCGTPELFHQTTCLDGFTPQISAIRQAEHILARAIHGTGIEPGPKREYNPAQDLEKLLKGELKPSLGPLGKRALESVARRQDSPVYKRVIDYDKYLEHMSEETENLCFSAYLSSGHVVIQYLAKDHAQFKPYFDRMRDPLNTKIKQARHQAHSVGNRHSSSIGPDLQGREYHHRCTLPAQTEETFFACTRQANISKSWM